MCEPATILSGVAAGVGILGGVATGLGEADAARDAARAEERNAGRARAQASDALQRGAEEVGRTRMAGSALTARQRLAYAASGVELQSGTPAQVGAATEAMTEQSADAARLSAAREAWGFTQEAGERERSARALRRKADAGIFSTLVGAAGQAAGASASVYSLGKKTGAF